MPDSRPNIVFILADDHAAHAIGAYVRDDDGLHRRVNNTPHIDRLADEGARFDNCFCTNSICSPSRATILTGAYSHLNGVTTISSVIDYRIPTFAECLRDTGYRTALYGKWHLGEHEPNLPRSRDFDDWAVFPGQGEYVDPELIFPDGRRRMSGYATDLVTDYSLDWLDAQPKDQPFCLMIHHKAPHRPWVPHPDHESDYPIGSIPEPDTLFDDLDTRSEAAKLATMRVADDLLEVDLKEPVPEELQGPDKVVERTHWAYQRYLHNYLATIQSIDDNVGRVLDYLDEHGLADNTIVVYTSDQGFFLGDHGWYDKRFMYEESLRMPYLMRWPAVIKPGTVVDELVTNTDFAATFLTAAGLDPAEVLPTSQGMSFLPVLHGRTPADWQTSMYYRYWEHDSEPHHVHSHYGVRTRRYKYVYYYSAGLGVPGSTDREFPPEWELFDLQEDPQELNNVADSADYVEIRAELETELARLQQLYQDEPYLPRL